MSARTHTPDEWDDLSRFDPDTDEPLNEETNR